MSSDRVLSFSMNTHQRVN